ncbi:hypothetical protein Rs2_40295 [Raphanus sativus]|nr:hypothetical protein Rs2_40295 [Raphanus sativus]
MDVCKEAETRVQLLLGLGFRPEPNGPNRTEPTIMTFAASSRFSTLATRLFRLILTYFGPLGANNANRKKRSTFFSLCRESANFKRISSLEIEVGGVLKRRGDL